MSIGRFRPFGAAPRGKILSVPVDRATFVIFAVGGHRFAVPVESVERVLRPATPHQSIVHGGRTMALTDLASTLGLALASSSRSRVIVFNDGMHWFAAAVDAVFEVATIDASDVAPLAFDGTRVFLPVGARGVFSRQGAAVLVLDVTRALRTRTQSARLEPVDALGGDAT